MQKYLFKSKKEEDKSLLLVSNPACSQQNTKQNGTGRL